MIKRPMSWHKDRAFCLYMTMRDKIYVLRSLIRYVKSEQKRRISINEVNYYAYIYGLPKRLIRQLETL